LFVGCFGDTVCIWDSYVYKKKGVHFILIHKSYDARSTKRYCFVRKYIAIPVQLEIFIFHYFGWCVLMIWTFIFNQFGCFCQFLMDNNNNNNYYYYYYYYYYYLLLLLFKFSALLFSKQITDF